MCIAKTFLLLRLVAHSTQLCEFHYIFKVSHRIIMSKTIRNEQTRGFLDKLQRSRKERKEARDLKADQLFNIDFLFDNLSPAQEI